MKHRAIYAGILLFIIFVFISLAQQDDFPVLKGPYLGQKPPGMTPEIFAPGIISTENFGEAGGAFTTNGTIFLFNRRTPPESHKTIYYTKLKKGVWTRPAPVPFNSKFGDWSFNFGPDGRTLFFSSKRPVSEGSDHAHNIWMTQLTGDGWDSPKILDYPVNTPNSTQSSPSLTRNKTLYFHSHRGSGFGGNDLYCTRLINGKYQIVENLGSVINTKYWEYDPLIGPNEDYIIFSSNKPGGFGQYNDMYISFRNKDGIWLKPQNLGEEFRDSGVSGVTHDGKFLFITNERRRAGVDDIYWVDIKFIERFRPDKKQ